MNLRPSGYEPDELPGCSTPRQELFIVVRCNRVAPSVAAPTFATTIAAGVNRPICQARRIFQGHPNCRCQRHHIAPVKDCDNAPSTTYRPGGSKPPGIDVKRRPTIFALCRPGSDLLSRVLRRSTIGAGAFHGRVRNGNGCSRPAITTRSAKGKREAGFRHEPCVKASPGRRSTLRQCPMDAQRHLEGPTGRGSPAPWNMAKAEPIAQALSRLDTQRARRQARTQPRPAWTRMAGIAPNKTATRRSDTLNSAAAAPSLRPDRATPKTRHPSGNSGGRQRPIATKEQRSQGADAPQSGT